MGFLGYTCSLTVSGAFGGGDKAYIGEWGIGLLGVGCMSRIEDCEERRLE